MPLIRVRAAEGLPANRAAERSAAPPLIYRDVEHAVPSRGDVQGSISSP
jgi:hypothetical protein